MKCSFYGDNNRTSALEPDHHQEARSIEPRMHRCSDFDDCDEDFAIKKAFHERCRRVMVTVRFRMCAL